MAFTILIIILVILAVVFLAALIAGIISAQKIERINNYQAVSNLNTARKQIIAGSIFIGFAMGLSVITLLAVLFAKQYTLVIVIFAFLILGTSVAGAVLFILGAAKIREAEVGNNEGSYDAAVVAFVISIVGVAGVIVFGIIYLGFTNKDFTKEEIRKKEREKIPKTSVDRLAEEMSPKEVLQTIQEKRVAQTTAINKNKEKIVRAEEPILPPLREGPTPEEVKAKMLIDALRKERAIPKTVVNIPPPPPVPTYKDAEINNLIARMEEESEYCRRRIQELGKRDMERQELLNTLIKEVEKEPKMIEVVKKVKERVPVPITQEVIVERNREVPVPVEVGVPVPVEKRVPVFVRDQTAGTTVRDQPLVPHLRREAVLPPPPARETALFHPRSAPQTALRSALRTRVPTATQPSSQRRVTINPEPKIIHSNPVPVDYRTMPVPPPRTRTIDQLVDDARVRSQVVEMAETQLPPPTRAYTEADYETVCNQYTEPELAAAVMKRLPTDVQAEAQANCPGATATEIQTVCENPVERPAAVNRLLEKYRGQTEKLERAFKIYSQECYNELEDLLRT